jgi:uncharacterized RDD family membrane protein YckC
MTVEAPLDKRHRRILTPEGVALTVLLGERGSRAAAFLIDLVFIVVVVVVGAIALAFSAIELRGYALALGLLGFFLLRVFYFPFFELHWRGATPGKRLLGLRVIDRHGGPLRPEAVVVRNLMREMEVFVPMTLLLVPGSAGVTGIGQLLLAAWMGIFVLMPLFTAADAEGLREIVRRICSKIGWPDSAQGSAGVTVETATAEAPLFLEAFYAAQRAYLERRMLFGHRRKDKHDKS